MLLVIRGTRAVQLLRGLIILAAPVALLTTFVDLPALNWLLGSILPALLDCVSHYLSTGTATHAGEAGDSRTVSAHFWRREEESPMIAAISRACLHLSQRRHGALIVIEQMTGLQEYIDTGILLNAVPSPELLLTIFNKNTDTARRRRGDSRGTGRGRRLRHAAIHSGISDRTLGLRHRAGLGISEVSDAIVVIVSEETGRITIAHNGRLIRGQDPTRLDGILRAFMQNRQQRVLAEGASSETTPAPAGRDRESQA